MSNEKQELINVLTEVNEAFRTHFEFTTHKIEHQKIINILDRIGYSNLTPASVEQPKQDVNAETTRKELMKLADNDFEIRHAGGGPFDEIDVKNAFIRGCSYLKMSKKYIHITTMYSKLEEEIAKLKEPEQPSEGL